MREITCKRCNRYVGTIREAKLIKDIVYLCPKCWRELNAQYGNNAESNAGHDLFDQIFGGKFK